MRGYLSDTHKLAKGLRNLKEMHVASEANPQWIPQCAVVCMICISAVLENAYIPGNLTYILLAETLSALFPAVSRGFIV